MSKLIILIVSAFVIAGIEGTPVTPTPITCSKTNEIYLAQGEATSACDTVCSKLGDTCNIRNIWAPFGCYCVKGYARDSNNICIPIRKCPPKVKTTTSSKVKTTTSSKVKTSASSKVVKKKTNLTSVSA